MTFESRLLAMNRLTDTIVESLEQRSVQTWTCFIEKAMVAVSDNCPAVRQYAARTLGNAARQPIFGQVAPVAAQKLAAEISKRSSRHNRRRAVKADAKATAFAADSTIRAFGLLCEHQEKNIGGDCSQAWSLWLDNIPLRCDKDQGQQSHRQLVDLVVREHPMVVSEQQLPKVFRAFASIHRTSFSNSALDKDVAQIVLKLPELAMRVASQLPQKQRKRLENILEAKQKVIA